MAIHDEMVAVYTINCTARIRIEEPREGSHLVAAAKPDRERHGRVEVSARYVAPLVHKHHLERQGM